MIHSNTSFGKLKEVIVGRELKLDHRIMDVTFKNFYKEALGQEIYESPFDGYSISHEFIVKRNNDLDELAKLLESFSVVVHRPEEITKVI